MVLARFIANLRFIPEGRRLELYPSFAMMRIKVLEIGDGWRRVRIRLPLNSVSRNPGGVMFGGFQACLADPIAAIACSRIFPGYSVWTRAMTVDFQKGGSTDLELRFQMDPVQEVAIAAELQEKGRATPTFEYGYYLADGSLCTLIKNTVALRPKGYKKATTPPANDGL